MKFIFKLNDAISKFLTTVGAILVIALMVGITAAAISRYFFGHPFGSMTELSAYSLLFITFLGAPLLASKDGHISVDVLPNALGQRHRDVVNAVINFLSALVTLAVAGFAFHTAQHAYVNHEVDANILETPMYLMFGVICLGSFFMAFAFFTSGLRKIGRLLNIT